MTGSPDGRTRRRYVLGGVLAALAALATVILFDVLATVFFALTVAYILAPLKRRLRRYGFSQPAATVVVTTAGVLGVLAVLAPLAYVLFVRFSEAAALLLSLPETVPLEFGGTTYEVVLVDAFESIEDRLQAFAAGVATRVPVTSLKFALFGFLVFSLLYNERDVRSVVLGVVPPGYRDVAEALDARARETLFAIYVLQAATAVATFLVAILVFLAFGFDSPVALATIAGILQFVPVVGPSVLVAALAVGDLLAGDPAGALAFVLVAGLLIGVIPDLVIRPRLARETADLSSSLYFIGFVGGLLSLGAIGIIVGPLVVALLVEATALVTAEFDASDGESGPVDRSEPAPRVDD